MKLYNTLTRQIDDLVPLETSKVKIYTCGLTVYSQPHIGNWIGYIYWDVLVRTLRHEGYDIERTQNYTDVGHLVSDDDTGEDKMEKGARREGITAWDVADKYIAIAEHEGYELLGLIRPTYVARATDYIQQQIDFVKKLEVNGFLYEIKDDGIYFDTAKFKDYGKLARLDIEGLQAGARVSVEGKRNITDFAVWKFSPESIKRDMEWESPWGKGFPGWHLECSVIAQETLGDQIDIHTGGVDHIPVHHINEIAQTESVTGKQFSRFWLHNNHMKVEGSKMSKSLGNIYTLQDILDHGYSMDDFRIFVLSKHYRTEGNFTWENLESAKNRLLDLKAMAALRWQPQPILHDHATFNFGDVIDEIAAVLSNDIHTEAALTYLSTVSKQVQAVLVSNEDADEFTTMLANVDELLGTHLLDIPDLTSEQRVLLGERQHARQEQRWDAADAIRDTMLEQGIGVRDTPSGMIWFPSR